MGKVKDGYDETYHVNSFDTFNSPLRQSIRDKIKEPKKALEYPAFVSEITMCNKCRGTGFYTKKTWEGYDNWSYERILCDCPKSKKSKEEIDKEWETYLKFQSDKLVEYFNKASELNRILHKLTDNELEILTKYIKGA